MKIDTIFGREPAFWIGFIESGLALAILLFLPLTSEQTALIMAAVVALFGAYTAWVTKDTLLGVLVGLVKAVLALAVGFGFQLAPETTAAIIAFLTVILGSFNRQQTEPLAFPPIVPPGAVAVADVGTL